MRKIIFWLALLLIFMIPWEDMITIAVLGSLARLAGFLVAGLWVFSTILAGNFRKPHAFHIMAYIFILWNIVSLFWSFGLTESFIRIRTYLQLMILIIILWDVLRKPVDLLFGMQAYVLGAWVAVMGTIINFIKGEQFRAYAGGRYSATGVNPGDLVIILALGIPLAWFLFFYGLKNRGQNLMKLVNLAYIPASIFCIVLTASRSGLFVIVPAIFFIFMTSNRLKPYIRVLAFLSLIVIILVLIPYLPQSTLERLTTAGSSISSGDLGGRVFIWKTALSFFVAHPYLGIGSGAFPAVSDFKSVVHNTFLSVLVETGIVGFILFMVILFIVFYRSIHQSKQFVYLWITVLAIWSIGVFTLTWERNKPTWLFLSFVIISSKNELVKRFPPQGIASSLGNPLMNFNSHQKS
jgi:O-antigen ligase